MKLGARVLKTGVAIVFALFIAELLNVPAPVFAGIAAIFAIQPSIYRSYLTILEQIQGNLIGAAIAIIFLPMPFLLLPTVWVKKAIQQHFSTVRLTAVWAFKHMLALQDLKHIMVWKNTMESRLLTEHGQFGMRSFYNIMLAR